MIPILYPANETQFVTNGICRLSDIISCLVTEERNGKFEVEFQYPVTGSRYSEITEGRIIYCTYDESGDAQPFDIYRHSAPLNGVVTFNARHISYRLQYAISRSFDVQSCTEFFSTIKSKLITDTPFTFTTDRVLPGVLDVKGMFSVRSVLGGMEGSVLDVYGPGEYKWDKFNVSFLNRRGEDLDVSIRYGKNLTELEYEYDESGIFNAVVPYWYNAETNLVRRLPEFTVSSGHAIAYIEPWTDENANHITDVNGVNLEFSTATLKPAALDLTSNFSERPTNEELREAARRYLAGNEPWLPNENLTISFVALWGTDEYASVAPLQKVHLCDTVQVIYTALGVNVRKKIIRTLYNVLLDRYDEIELGSTAPTFADVVQDKIDSIEIRNDFVTPSKMDDAIAAVTKMITGGAGGYLHISYANGHPSEILFTQYSDPARYQIEGGVLRINQNGIGFSSRGTRGPYTQAWTIDGNFITQFIRAGRISSKNGNTYFDLDSAVLATELTSLNAGDGQVTTFRTTLESSRLVMYRNGVELGRISGTTNSNDPNFRAFLLQAKTTPNNYTSGHNGFVFKLINTSDDTSKIALRIGGYNRVPGYEYQYDDLAILFGRFRATQGIIVGNGNNSPRFYKGADETTSDDEEYKRLFLTSNLTVKGNWGVTAVVYHTSSDARLKDFLPYNEAYDRLIDRIEIKLFRWREAIRRDTGVHIGVSAQELQRAIEAEGIEECTLVHENNDEDHTLSVNYIALNTLLIRRVQQQQKRIDDLEARLARLEALVNANT